MVLHALPADDHRIYVSSDAPHRFVDKHRHCDLEVLFAEFSVKGKGFLDPTAEGVLFESKKSKKDKKED